MAASIDHLVPDALREAAARVRRGWVQHKLVEGDHVCAAGAIGDASYRPSFMESFRLQIAMRLAVERALNLPSRCDSLGRRVCPIPAWNDDVGQTAENVAIGLEYAALVFEQEHARVLQARADRWEWIPYEANPA